MYLQLPKKILVYWIMQFIITFVEKIRKILLKEADYSINQFDELINIVK